MKPYEAPEAEIVLFDDEIVTGTGSDDSNMLRVY